MSYLRNGPSIYQTNDGALVLEGDPRAALLVVASNCQISDEAARTYGLVDAAGRLIEPATSSEPSKAPTDDDEDDPEVSAQLVKQAKTEHANKLRQPTPANKTT